MRIAMPLEKDLVEHEHRHDLASPGAGRRERGVVLDPEVASEPVNHPHRSLVPHLTNRQLADKILAYCRAREQVMEKVLGTLAAAAAEHLGGAAAIGRDVVSDADLANAVASGFSVETIDALKERGVTDREVGDLIVKPRTLSHRRANRSRLTVEESDRAARVARTMALAERAFASREKADRWLHRNLDVLGGCAPMKLIRTDAGARIVENLLGAHLLGRSCLMWIWRLSGAEYAERFDGGFGLLHDGRWNDRGRPITYCATGPALCVLEKHVHIEDASLIPDDTVLVRYEVPDDLRIEDSPLEALPEAWRMDVRLTRSIGNAWLDGGSACLLRVPSAVVPIPDANDRNLIVNHRHAEAARITVARIEKFDYDPRLFAFA